MITKLTLRRVAETRQETLSMLEIDGIYACFVLEPGFRDPKVPGETRIPAGVYPVGLRQGSPKFQSYDARFKRINHHGMLWIQEIPDFEYVYFHIGNYAKDTDGCLLVGRDAYMVNDYKERELTIGRSVDAYAEVYPYVRRAIETPGRDVYLEVLR